MEDPATGAVRDALDRLGLPYEVYEHPAVFTVDQALEHWRGIDAVHCKNLFLRNKKGDRHYLVVAEHTRDVDLRRLAGAIGDDRLSFGSPERLARCLGLSPGSVSPFGILNDARHEVRVVIDAALRTAARVGFHPNVNTATLVLTMRDFEVFLRSSGNVVQFVSLA